MDEQPTPHDWQSWLDQHGPKLLFFARQQARSDADAQDLMQEAIIEAARRKGWNGPPPPALVFATIHRRAIDLARSHERRSAREAAAGSAQSDLWFDPSPEERERATLIQGAMEKLPQIYREVIALKLWGDLTFSEIAAALDIPANTAASRYRYGLEQLRKLANEVFT